MALLETLLFGVMIFILERSDVILLYVDIYNSEIFFSAELGLAFFLFFLLIDFITEFVSYNIKILKKSPPELDSSIDILLISGFLSIVQTALFLSFEFILDALGIFGITILTPEYQSVSILEFIIVFFTLIFISELIVEIIKKKAKLDDLTRTKRLEKIRNLAKKKG